MKGLTIMQTNRAERIRAALASLAPAEIEVVDESEKHRGHGGWREGGETHYRIRIRAESLAGLSRVECHRRINALLADEFAMGLHALAIDAGAA
jgi:BolA protein